MSLERASMILLIDKIDSLLMFVLCSSTSTITPGDKLAFSSHLSTTYYYALVLPSLVPDSPLTMRSEIRPDRTSSLLAS